MDSILTHSPDYYVLGASPSPAAFDGRVTPELTSAEAAALLRGEHLPESTLRIDQTAGRKPGDFLWLSVGPIISKHVWRYLGDAGLVGWRAYGVLVYDKSGVLFPDYLGLSITGRCSSITHDSRDSALFYEAGVRSDLPYYRGLVIDHGDWAPADFFMAADQQTRYICMTKKARDILTQVKVSNVRIRHISEVRVPANDRPQRLKTNL